MTLSNPGSATIGPSGIDTSGGESLVLDDVYFREASTLAFAIEFEGTINAITDMITLISAEDSINIDSNVSNGFTGAPDLLEE